MPDAAAEVVRRDFVAAVAGRGEGLVTESRLLNSGWDLSLTDVEVPVRLWHGDGDGNAPFAGARALADALPNAELTVLDGADHLNTLLRCRSDVVDEY